MRRTKAADLNDLVTERSNPRSRRMDAMNSLEIAQLMNREDALVPRAIAKALPQIARAINLVADSLSRGGRLIYVGTGTSGRLGALDASECGPTFGASARIVQYVIAGGTRALGHASVAAEDSAEQARADMTSKKLTRDDVVLGIAASGRTPYTVAALEFVKEQGATTIAITAVRNSPLALAAQLAIEIEVGPEVLAGSTRLKAGTMEKMVLNMISTGAFTRLGYVYGNRMVNLQARNAKLKERAVAILCELTDIKRKAALALLRKSDGSLPVALVIQKLAVDPIEARRRLRRARGNVRAALEGD